LVLVRGDAKPGSFAATIMMLRLVDTMIGITVGVACKWAASMFYRIVGEEVR
jgi:hypothetical protein